MKIGTQVPDHDDNVMCEVAAEVIVSVTPFEPDHVKLVLVMEGVPDHVTATLDFQGTSALIQSLQEAQSRLQAVNGKIV